MSPEAASNSQTLCLSCGLCCNGGLHNWTNLRSIETAQAQALGLRVFVLPEGSPAFLQPCDAFHVPECSIYDHRPQSCRDYRCQLLIALEQAQTSLEEALVLTGRARELIAALREYMEEPDPRLSLERQVRYQWAHTPPPPQAAQILAELAALLESRWGVRWSPLSMRLSRRQR